MKRIILKLRAEGWRDWQLLGAIKTITVHYRVSKSLKDQGNKLDYEDFERELRRKSKEPEKSNDPVVPIDRFDYTNLYNTLGSSKRTLKKQMCFERSDDIPHQDPFQFNLDKEIREKIYQNVVKLERSVLLDLEILSGKRILNKGLGDSIDSKSCYYTERQGHATELYLYNLKRLPESIGNLKHLQTLTLDCFNLHSLPNSIGNLESLIILDTRGCANLRHIPSEIGKLKSLKRLIIRGHMKILPESIGNLENLETLIFASVSSLRALPNSIGSLNSLKKLDIHTFRSEFIRLLPESIGNLSKLQTLNLSECSALKYLPETVGNLRSLKVINLDHCFSLKTLPKTIGNLINLENLFLAGCKSLISLPNSIGNLKSLEKLKLASCKFLKSLPYTIGNIRSLIELDLRNCDYLRSLPESIGRLKSLEKLDLSNSISFTLLPESIGNLRSLKFLYLDGCKSLNKLPHGIANLKNNRSISIKNCNFIDVPLPIINFKEFKSINVDGNPIGRENNKISAIMKDKFIDTLPLTPDNIYKGVLENKIQKIQAFEKLTSLLEVSNSDFIHTRSIEVIELLEIKTAKLFRLLENILVSYENQFVRAASAKALISLFEEKCEIPVRWIIRKTTSPFLITSIFKHLDLIDNNLNKILKEEILTKYAEVYGVCLEEAKFFLDLEVLNIERPHEPLYWYNFKIGHWSQFRCSSKQYQESSLYEYDCAYAVLNNHVIAVDLRYWEVGMVPKSIGLLTELKSLVLSSAFKSDNLNLIDARMDEYVPVLPNMVQQFVNSCNTLIKLKEIDDYCDYEQISKTYLKEASDFFKGGKFTKARRILKIGLRYSPKNAHIWNFLGTVYLKCNNVDNAIQAYKKAISIDPRFSDAIDNINHAYSLKGEYRKSIGILKDFLNLKPRYTVYRLKLGENYLKIEDYDNAISTFNTALKVFPKSTEAWINLGLCYYHKKEYGNMAKIFRNSLEFLSKDKKLWYMLGVSLNLNKEYDEAMEACIHALEIDPDYEDAKKLKEKIMKIGEGK